MSRWIVNDCAVHPTPSIVRHGIPQGDPAVPVVMNLLMFALMRRVEQKLSLLKEPLFLHGGSLLEAFLTAP